MFGNNSASTTMDLAEDGNELDSSTIGTTQFPEEYLEPLMFSHPFTGSLYIALTLVAMVSGLLGNCLIIAVHVTHKTFNKIEVRGNQRLVINMALADLFVVSVADPMCILGAIGGQEFLSVRPALCSAIGSLCLTACICALLSLMCLTVYRYLFVFHKNSRVVQLFTRWYSLAFCVMLWVVAALLEMPNFLGWGGHVFDKKNHSCSWDRAASYSFTAFVTLVLVGGPLGLMGVIYARIFMLISKSKITVNAHNASSKTSKNIWDASRSLFVIFAAYIVCWTPYCLVLVVDRGNMFSMQVYLWVTWLAHVHSALSCVVYWFANDRFQQAVKDMLVAKKISASVVQGGKGVEGGVEDKAKSSNKPLGVSADLFITKTAGDITGHEFPSDYPAQPFKMIGLSPSNGPRENSLENA